MLRHAHQRNHAILWPVLAGYAVNVRDVILIKVCPKLHGVARHRQAGRVAIFDKAVQERPLEEELARMIAQRRHHSSFVFIDLGLPEYSGNQLPFARRLSPKYESIMLTAKAPADGRHGFPELVQGGTIDDVNQVSHRALRIL